jgi:alginate O-acetyltransferase complex protein AlgJ
VARRPDSPLTCWARCNGQAKRQQVFLRTDTHWTPEGAEIAAKLAKTIADKFPLSGEPQNFVTEPAEKVTHKGDLRLFLPLDPLFENLMPAQEPLQKRNTVAAETGRVTTRCSPTTKSRWH